jgi:hypothetical protein
MISQLQAQQRSSSRHVPTEMPSRSGLSVLMYRHLQARWPCLPKSHTRPYPPGAQPCEPSETIESAEAFSRLRHCNYSPWKQLFSSMSMSGAFLDFSPWITSNCFLSSPTLMSLETDTYQFPSQRESVHSDHLWQPVSLSNRQKPHIVVTHTFDTMSTSAPDYMAKIEITTCAKDHGREYYQLDGTAHGKIDDSYKILCMLDHEDAHY